jgi:3-oxoacyl-[acyl-carrier protein] reductase
MKTNLKNKKIIITGASKGLGAVCARALAENGAQLVLMARTKSELEDVRSSCRNNKRHLVVAMDLVDNKQCAKAVSQAESFLGEVDVVLHVVGGGLGLRDHFLSAADLWRLFQVNLGIAAEINRITGPKMIARKRGNLVHVCSIASLESTGSVGYNTVKAALAAYVKTLGRELARSGVVVTGILPGGFYAPQNSWIRLKSRDPEAVKRFIKERLPRGFLGKAEEIVPLILFLCSDAASMMGGCLVPIDAGEGKAYLNYG